MLATDEKVLLFQLAKAQYREAPPGVQQIEVEISPLSEYSGTRMLNRRGR